MVYGGVRPELRPKPCIPLLCKKQLKGVKVWSISFTSQQIYVTASGLQFPVQNLDGRHRTYRFLLILWVIL